MRKDYDLEDAFAAIEDELIESMMRNMKRHKMEEIGEDKQWEMWQALQLKTLEEYKTKSKKKFTSWFSDINAQISEVIKQANQMGKMEQEIEILNAIKNGFKGARKASSTLQAEFFKLNERKLEALVNATTDDLQKAEYAILRRANDQYRKAIFNAQVYANSGAGTYEKAVDMATKDMLSAGLNCVEYANGTRHTLKDYAEMAIRTASKRAYLQGEGVMRQNWGISTVIMNKRGNPCPKCLPFCGKVLIDDVWSGGKVSDGPYPLMSTAIAAGLYHPRCKDSHTTYFEGISTPPDDRYAKAEIQQIEDDYREEQKQQYAKRQAEKYERMEKHSLDGENKRKYRKRKTEWNEQVAQLDDTEKILNTTYKAKDLDDLSLEELRKIAEKKGTEYYKSGKSGISFGDATPEEAAKKLAQAGSKTSLKKDILSMQKKMGKTVVKTGDSDIIKLLEEEKYALNQYISFESYGINEKLRNGLKLSELDSKMIMNLDSALKKMPKYEGNVSRSLYFGDNERVEEFISQFKVGQKKSFKEYLSTTNTNNLYNPDGEIQIFVQNSKKGRNISHINEQEAEILYERNSSFRVLNIVKQDDKYWILMEEA